MKIKEFWMMILDGKTVANSEKERIKNEIASTKEKVCLAVVLVGDDSASQSYVASKEKACIELGIRSIVLRMPENTEESELIAKVKEYNRDDSINGILVQVPLPKHINEKLVLETIDPAKDVDCFHPYNIGRLLIGNSVVEPCTPKGIMKMLEYFHIDVAGKNAVIIGRSNIVGKPISMLLMHKNATITICHSKTKNIKEICSSADILVAAIGKPLYVKEDMVKEGAVVVDVGINRVEDASRPKGYRVVGDVDYEAVKNKAGAITPVPGGVGLMTVAALMDNTLQLARLQNETRK
jgi:methylenetetrahydrofolate dehydrogenase (NADP+) / methenyltetrahydrofolate cyclohydrolase